MGVKDQLRHPKRGTLKGWGDGVHAPGGHRQLLPVVGSAGNSKRGRGGNSGCGGRRSRCEPSAVTAAPKPKGREGGSAGAAAEPPHPQRGAGADAGFPAQPARHYAAVCGDTRQRRSFGRVGGAACARLPPQASPPQQRDGKHPQSPSGGAWGCQGSRVAEPSSPDTPASPQTCPAFWGAVREDPKPKQGQTWSRHSGSVGRCASIPPDTPAPCHCGYNSTRPN